MSVFSRMLEGLTGYRFECYMVLTTHYMSVFSEMVEALQIVGLSATEDMDMVAQIKGEVRKLCKRNIIASQIVLNEADEMREQNLSNMIYLSQEEIKVSTSIGSWNVEYRSTR